jgi:hypothetical protein
VARRKKREEKPAKSNRGRENARGVLIVFDEPVRPDPPAPAEDEPLTRDVDQRR